MPVVVGLLTLTVVWQGRVAGAEAPVTVSSTFQQANERYRNGTFDEAASGYRRILALGLENGELYYNLGNALLKRGKNSEALWAYLKAKAFLPRDADVRANLAYVQSLLQPGVDVSVRPSGLIRWLSLRQRFATAELAGWSGLWVWLVVCAGILSTWWPQSRRVARPLAWLSGLVAAVFLTALSVQTAWIDAVPTAIVVPEQLEVKFSPQSAGTTHFTLPAGAIVQRLRHEFGWVQLKRRDGLAGWAPEEALSAL